MLGNPKYVYGDLVKFHVKDDYKRSYEIKGFIEDAHYSDRDILYDILDYEKQNIVYEDISESELILVRGNKLSMAEKVDAI